jgi:hypothetical protein
MTTDFPMLQLTVIGKRYSCGDIVQNKLHHHAIKSGTLKLTVLINRKPFLNGFTVYRI